MDSMQEGRSSKMLISSLLLTMFCQAFGPTSGTLLAKYRGDIEGYIMNGYGGGWKHCDLMCDTSEQVNLSEESMNFVIDTELIHSLDIKATFSPSSCLLISAHIKSNQSLSELIKFGWSVIQHKRLALVLKIERGMTLNMATNTSKMPFLVAATLEDGDEQFLCPVIGEADPRLQHVMCDRSYSSYKDKTLRVGIFGIPPYFAGECNFL